MNSDSTERPDVPKNVENFYYINMGVILGVCLALLADRAFPIMEGAHTVSFSLALIMIWLTLLVTYFEYYYTIIYVRITEHLFDVFSAIVLGTLQIVAIYFVKYMNDGGVTHHSWWVAQLAYSIAGAIALLNSYRYMKRRKQSEEITRSILYSMMLCAVFFPVTFLIAFFCRGAETSMLLLTSVGLLAMIFKSRYFIARQEQLDAAEIARSGIET